MPQNSAPARLSVREFARCSSCNEKLVRRALLQGRLHLDPEGRIDPAQVDSGWRRPNPYSRDKSTGRGEQATVDAARRLDNAARAFVARLDGSGFDQFLADMLSGRLASLAEALRIKENALALKHLLAARSEAKRLLELAD